MEKLAIQIISSTPNVVQFSLDNCDISLANALRRVMISEVPTMAPQLINIYENTSALHDEFLAQRLALIPFVSDAVDKYKYTWECSCENSEECQVCKAYFVLQVKNEEPSVREVSSLDIRAVFDNAELGGKPVEPVKFFSNISKELLKVPIVKLSQNQEVNIRFDVQKGIGKMHSKWCPVAIATFHPEPEVKVDFAKMQKAALEVKQAIVECCPRGVYQLKEASLEVVRPQECIFCEECTKVCGAAKQPNMIKIGKKKEKFIFTVEGTGVMPPLQVIGKAIQVLKTKLEELEKRID